MSKRYPLATFVLPAVVDPPRICTTIQVPNDPQHIAAFLGAIRGLGSAYNWADDLAHTAKDVATVWRDVFDNIVVGNCASAGGDDMQFRQNGCKLEFSIDCVNWITLYDPTECIAQLTGQPGPGGDIPANECQNYTLVLQANQRLLLPVGVQGGNRITVTGQAGGASDGTSSWNCPDGTPYILGACIGSAGHAGGDPSPVAYHMALLALVDGIYYDVSTDGSGFLVPDGTVLTSLEFVVNDDDISNNSGSYSFTVEVCNTPTATWTHDFDFTVSDGNWTAYVNNAVYSAGVGWRNGGSAADETCYIKFDLLHDTTLNVWDAPFTTDAANIGYQGAALTGNGTQLVRDNSLADSPGGTLSFAGSFAMLSGQSLIFFVNTNSGAPHNTIVASMHFEGTGTDPFIP
jgi:hypothetical protein